MRAARPAIHARRAALVAVRDGPGDRPAPRPRRGCAAPCVPGEHRGAARLGRPGDLRPVRRREPPDDAQHRPPGRTHPARTQHRLQDLARAWSGPTPPGFERQGASQRGWVASLVIHRAGVYRARRGATPCSRRCGSRRGRSGPSAPGRPAGLGGSPRLGHDRLRRDRRPAARQGVPGHRRLHPRPAVPARRPTAGARARGPARRSPSRQVGRQFVKRRSSGPWSHLPGGDWLRNRWVLVVPAGPIRPGID